VTRGIPPTTFEPYIGSRTTDFHHDHHQAYVTNLNNAAKDNSVLGSMPCGELSGKSAHCPRRSAQLFRQKMAF
jgi:superoxide dismutase